ncbi:type IV toxin-antitoxin system AbiEi family antitoxin domain-containing protein [Arthrobacter castelli]|uniref:type IV toxin-antitoxin system AbiEi family antitoxin domain-containing protein n=1 Tax=Arthrobacter castelli TaxID=271431 RepID=UPI000418C898|nr:type IV toxin-antitoxin system AbiEi family antitoxin domain-containing protein [Arthrobacter castelli]
MKPNGQTLDRLPHDSVFSISDAVNQGVSKSNLYRLRDAGVIDQVAPGLYVYGDGIEADLDLIEAAHKAPLGTICLNSALARHGLIDEIPSAIDLALPRSKTPPRLASPVTWHLFDKATFNVGRSELSIEGGEGLEIGIYSPERSIVDAFRLRASAGYETGLEALRNWLKRRGSHPAMLMDMAATLPRAKGPLQRALEILL